MGAKIIHYQDDRFEYPEFDECDAYNIVFSEASKLIELPVPKSVLNNNEWISFQPLFGILLALELTAIGIVLYKKGDATRNLQEKGKKIERSQAVV